MLSCDPAGGQQTATSPTSLDASHPPPAILKKQQDLNLNYQHLRWHTDLNQDALDAIQKMELPPRPSPQPVPPPTDHSNHNVDLNHSIEVPSDEPPRHRFPEEYVVSDSEDEDENEETQVDPQQVSLNRCDANGGKLNNFQPAPINPPPVTRRGPPLCDTTSIPSQSLMNNDPPKPVIRYERERNIMLITLPHTNYQWASPRDFRTINPIFSG
ncbi:hypothetical protein BS50DRAFT_656664 [Corynespora cassiicola Philippines]|uniref:Uncharacterized protein n=1 Tax=Corynespora cassiicola Philippines TaxID=1448308 RepID=A0A2T2N2N4_CORCC|nr:hypothetical protein BS50DRAFT_656664 [Corynespora cassiicola Philippines]